MKLQDTLKLTGNPAEIPDSSRHDLPQFFVEMGFKLGAEIGVYKGVFTKKLCEVGLKIYGIDSWRTYRDNEENTPESQQRWDCVYNYSQRALAPYINNGSCILVRKTSMEALEDFEDESLDFVYIDGHHEFRFIAEDLVEWTKKVKKGGIVSGHDYMPKNEVPNSQDLDVKYVVDAYTKAFSINNWYVLGQAERIPGETRETSRSWMWIKK